MLSVSVAPCLWLHVMIKGTALSYLVKQVEFSQAKISLCTWLLASTNTVAERDVHWVSGSKNESALDIIYSWACNRHNKVPNLKPKPDSSLNLKTRHENLSCNDVWKHDD